MGKQKRAREHRGVYKGECEGKYVYHNSNLRPHSLSCRRVPIGTHRFSSAMDKCIECLGNSDRNRQRQQKQLAIETAGLVTLHLQPTRRSSIPTINRAPNSELAKHPGTVISPTKHLTRQDRKDRKVASSN
jgi:hypothetical protein